MCLAVILLTNRFALTRNWSLSWSKLDLWKPGFKPGGWSVLELTYTLGGGERCTSVPITLIYVPGGHHLDSHRLKVNVPAMFPPIRGWGNRENKMTPALQIKAVTSCSSHKIDQ